MNKLELDLNDKNNREFIIDVVANALLTVMTFCWTFYSMWYALQQRRRNHSMQMKAMWRVEESHFNTNFTGGLSQLEGDNKQILRKILSIIG